jgi:hypothetical protein
MGDGPSTRGRSGRDAERAKVQVYRCERYVGHVEAQDDRGSRTSKKCADGPESMGFYDLGRWDLWLLTGIRKVRNRLFGSSGMAKSKTVSQGRLSGGRDSKLLSSNVPGIALRINYCFGETSYCCGLVSEMRWRKWRISEFFRVL